MFAKSSTILAAVVGYLALGAVASPAAGQGAAGRLAARAELGGVDVDLACKVQNGDLAWYATNIGSNWGDWKCRKGNEWRDVNMNAACSSQYNRPEAYASHGSSVWDWKCNV